MAARMEKTRHAGIYRRGWALRLLLPLERPAAVGVGADAHGGTAAQGAPCWSALRQPPHRRAKPLTIVAFETADPSTGSLDSSIAAVGQHTGDLAGVSAGQALERG